MKRFFLHLGIFVACAAVTLNSTPASAYSFVYHFDTGGDPIFSGTPPVSPAPWVDALFQDVTPGTVLLTISNPGLTANEKLTEFYINLDPALSPTSLNFTPVANSGGFTLPTIDQ